MKVDAIMGTVNSAVLRQLNTVLNKTPTPFHRVHNLVWGHIRQLKYLESIYKVVINNMMGIKQIGTMKSEARGYYFSMGNQGSNIELFSV